MIEKKNNIIPIEVKSAYNTKAKSLDLYINQYNPIISFVSSLKEIDFSNNKKYLLLYAIHLIDEILEDTL